VQRGGLSICRKLQGVSNPLAKGGEVVPGYLSQYAVRGGPDRIDNTASVKPFMTFRALRKGAMFHVKHAVIMQRVRDERGMTGGRHGYAGLP
jgi:hypothetical protein